MKRFISLFIAGIILILNINIFALTDTTLSDRTSTQININKEVKENQEIKTEDIRNQNILVPTKEGVQKATAQEAEEINKYEKYSLEDLSKSYLLGDYESGKILEAYNIDEIRPMAST